jgi:class 3 adenylate cyclase/tetratricopeptide (TPR) repeat protein
MRQCHDCGEQNSEEARFCQACGSSLSAPAEQIRKTVTVLFCDVTGSTPLGERLDPESLQRVMARFFDELRAVVERHGGVVEKFIGDAIKAVFGDPLLHEDDALRACRAALDMREALVHLNKELETSLGVTLSCRTGLNTGEVVAGAEHGGQRLILGDPVNVAARFEQAASPGEILIGEATFRLVKDAIEAEALSPVTLKGKSSDLKVWRLQSARKGHADRAPSSTSSMVGRQAELASLHQAYTRVRAERICLLMKVFGAAGVGKSRLVSEFFARLEGETTIIRGRCLSYGDAITFFPLAEMVRDAAAITGAESPASALAKLSMLMDGAPEAALVATLAGQACGLASPTVSSEELLWAIRKLFEHVARKGSLIVLLDDAHWAEPPLLDFIEQVVAWTQDAPILVLVVARPEIQEAQPSWAANQVDSGLLNLKVLAPNDAAALLENLLEGAELPDRVEERIIASAAGNPLFIEEMIGVLVDDGLIHRGEDGGWTTTLDIELVAVPATIQLLLAARLDRLGTEERVVIQRASIEGQVFHRGSVSALSPDDVRPTVGSCLVALTRKELIRPEKAELGTEDAFRFHHLLVRDAAYAGLPKSTRAELHERFADWLEAAVGERLPEYEDILGYHLEQAYRYHLEVDPRSARLRRIAWRAAHHLESAGRRAADKDDLPAAIRMLDRALELMPEDTNPIPILFARARALGAFGLPHAKAWNDLQRAAESQGDAVTATFAAAEGVFAQAGEGAPSNTTRHEALLSALDTVTVAGRDDLALVLNRHIALVEIWLGRLGSAFERAWTAFNTAVVRESRREQDLASILVAMAAVGGLMPVAEAMRTCQELLSSLEGRRLIGSRVQALYGLLQGLAGDVDSARASFRRARETLRDLGGGQPLDDLDWFEGDLERMLGHYAQAEGLLAPLYESQLSAGDANFASTLGCLLAECMLRQDRPHEAVALVDRARKMTPMDDVATQAGWRAVKAECLALHNAGNAEALAREAVGIAEANEYAILQGESWASLARTLLAAGRIPESVSAFGQAFRRYQRKGAVACARTLRRWLEENAPELVAASMP